MVGKVDGMADHEKPWTQASKKPGPYSVGSKIVNGGF